MAVDTPESGARGRTLVLWCPDWPAVAVARQAGVPSSEPAAIFRANRVVVCTAAARRDGVRIGMRRREAQSRCPSLVVFALSGDLGGDLPAVAGRMFEPVAVAVEQLVPGIEILRPGLIAVAVRGPRRYFGDERLAAEQIVDAVEALDVEARIGIADELEVAVLAARQQRIVPPGGDRVFCAALPVVEFAREEVLAPTSRLDLVNLLQRLGIRTGGELAALPVERVATRFGADGLAVHRLASGRGQRAVSRRILATDLTLEQQCDPPLDRVDTAAFVARALAERFHSGLADAGLACSRLTITAHFTEGPPAERTWRAARPLTAAATADRLRWQLDGWLTARAARHRDSRQAPAPSATEPTPPSWESEWKTDGVSGVTRLVLEPVEAIDAGRIQYGLWGSDGDDDHRAGWAFARIQGLLGPQSVLTGVLSGGRTARDRVTMVSWGDERVPARDPGAPWPGALPAPSPGVLETADAGRPAGLRAQLTDTGGAAVRLTDRGQLTGIPTAVGTRLVVGWAGPWLFDERWWEAPVPADQLVAAPARCAARIQVLCDDGSALLLGFVPTPDGIGRWELEGVYD